jgi:hypothetical protein
MSARPADHPEPVLLVIADISGYTRYMTANAKTLAHSHAIITELVQSIVHEVQLPLEVAKLEGDAVFFFCRKQQAAGDWLSARRMVANQLLNFFHLFGAKLGELSGSTTCNCHACTHIERLRLKIVVHSGEALFHRVLNFTELAGVDVIIVHRLLKNSVNADQYLLLTEAARGDLAFPENIPMAQSAESYEDIGRINTLVYTPEGELPPPSPAPVSFGVRFQRSWQLYLKLWFAPFARRPAEFHHVSSGASNVGRIFFASFSALFTPIFLPVGAVFALIRASKTKGNVHHAAGCHEHREDGSCCRH